MEPLPETSIPSWRLEKRKSKYAQAREVLEATFSSTGVECAVRSLEGLSFRSWDEFHAYLDAYARETHQTYTSRDTKLTARYNSEQTKRRVKNFTPVPPEFKHARVRYDCKHSHSNMSKNKNLIKETCNVDAAKPKLRAFYSACPVKMHVQVHRNEATHDEWRVLITSHLNVHNHNVSDDAQAPVRLGVPGMLPLMPDATKRQEAMDELLGFFATYQAAREDPDAFQRRYSDLHTYIYQSLWEDTRGDPMDPAMQLFQKLPRPHVRNDKRPKFTPSVFEIL
ncbi:hypothetical protein SPRG_07172 [Saprolegnia parasitica CBS 223.65]|uniref:FAR1 domain-containing protein n=1 Tax=Saprolegnia parasitica (strain CBS 223.65) TaxID=695850 RepID=A0A067CAV5_SAPPC|nr:hypothetical protein SPRG_07172 [Saprolegnia parasitica CBS 223.65]KDO27899.1 hypothetical protein SPRG_07172 [Saprolegnia parasitica CBS 223.65]|eukprot:XP_012201356.1 hypothetical protein SPRG_07172 [Saprolegnia parasitica CBS 223.65]